MRAMILAAGRGVRLGSLTEKTPKPLIQVGKKALIEYQLEALKIAGFSEVVINTGWLGEQLIERLGKGQRYGLNIEYSIEPTTGLETGGGVYQALALLGEQPFLLVNADIYHHVSFQELKNKAESMSSNTLAHLVMVENPTFNPEGDFCLDGTVLKLKSTGLPVTRGQSKKLKPLTYSGIGIYRPELFAASRAGRFPLAPLLKQAIQQSKVTGQLTQAAWFDAGTPQRIEQIENFIRLAI